eukprot:snap_masked-scaffold_50-processed-gene-1.55-mRNA-1 protein AED:1.00 eAED:1.00 QI:0/0/0/0/1/1/2/0/341
MALPNSLFSQNFCREEEELVNALETCRHFSENENLINSQLKKEYFVAGTSAGCILLSDTISRSVLFENPKAHEKGVSHLQTFYLDNIIYIISQGREGILKLFQITFSTTFNEHFNFSIKLISKIYNNNMFFTRFSIYGNNIFTGGSKEEELKILKIDKEKKFRILKTETFEEINSQEKRLGFLSRIHCLENKCLCLFESGALVLYDFMIYKIQSLISLSLNTYFDFDFFKISPTDILLCASLSKSYIKLYSINFSNQNISISRKAKVQLPNCSSRSVQFLSRDKFVAALSDGSLGIYSTQTLISLQNIELSHQSILCLKLSSLKFLLAGDKQGKIFILKVC